MADEETAPGDNNPSETPEPEAGQPSHAVQIRRDVAEIVQSRGGEVRKRIVDMLAESIIIERTEKLKKAFSKRENMYRDFNKLRPDVVTFNVDGSRASEGYTKPRLEEIKKAREELAKLDKAIGRAIDDADYEPLAKFIGG